MSALFESIADQEGLEPLSGVVVHEELSVREIDGWRQTVTMVEPADPVPETSMVLACFHGGGFPGGHPSSAGRVAKALALTLGVRTFSFRYRLGKPRAPSYPRPLEDIAFAWSWMEEHAERWSVDPARRLLGGDSAG